MSNPEEENILLLISAPGKGFSKKRKSGKDESLPLSRLVDPLGLELFGEEFKINDFNTL